MIYTITLNPAIDHAILLEEKDRSGTPNHKSSYKEAAGKGINVSRVLKKIGVDSVACTILGGENGAYIQNQLKQEEIPMLVQTITDNTRENTKLIPSEGPVQEQNAKGPSYSVNLIQTLFHDVFSQAKIGDIIVLSGSIPQGIPVNIYQHLISDCHKRGLSVFLDTSGPALALGITAKPDMIKPNLQELEQLSGHDLPSVKSIIKYGKSLINKGIKEVIITLGKDGSLYLSNDFIIQIPPLEVPVINTVGAGDSFVAGFVAMRDQNQSVENCLTYATAVATASVTEPTTVLTDSSQIMTYQEAVILNPLKI
jgi:1-phosphofructokinase